MNSHFGETRTKSPWRITPGHPVRWYHFWPLLIGPAAIAVVILARYGYSQFDILDEQIERLTPGPLLVVMCLYAVRTIATRNPLYTILTVVSATLLLRELHWDPAIKIAAYPVLVICGIWMLTWRDVLAEPFGDRRHNIWLLAALATYVLGQLLAQRVFKFVPGERAIHSKVEEAVELSGHLGLLVASLVGNWRYFDVIQRTVTIRRGFVIGPTGRLWAKLTCRAAEAEGKRSDEAPPGRKESDDGAETP